MPAPHPPVQLPLHRQVAGGGRRATAYMNGFAAAIRGALKITSYKDKERAAWWTGYEWGESCLNKAEAAAAAHDRGSL